MHRQSLGSPAAKLHANGVIIKETSSSPSSSSELLAKLQKKKKLLSNDDDDDDDDDDEDEKQNKKPHNKTTPSSGHPEKFVHLIPVLTLLCIFILYLNSHDPSQIDLAQFNGFKTLSRPIDSKNIDKIQRVSEIGKGEFLAIRRTRNLQGVDKVNSKYRVNRKIGHV